MHLQKLEVPEGRKDLTSNNTSPFYCHVETKSSLYVFTVSKKEGEGLDKSLYAPLISCDRSLATKSEVEERRP